MMEDLNPYRILGSPQGTDNPASQSTLPDHRVPNSIMRLLEQTRGWILFFSVLGYLLTALATFVSLFLFFGGFLSSQGSGSSLFFSATGYVLVASLFAVPSHFLWQLCYWIRRASLQPSWRELEEVMRAQRIFWMASGVLAALLLGFIFILTLLTMLMA